MMNTTPRQITFIVNKLETEREALIVLEQEATEQFRSGSGFTQGLHLLTASATTLSDHFKRLFWMWTRRTIDFDRVLIDAEESAKCVDSLKTLRAEKEQALSHLLDAANSMAHAAFHMESAHPGHPSVLLHRFSVEDNIADAVDSLEHATKSLGAWTRLAGVMALQSIVADSVRRAA